MVLKALKPAGNVGQLYGVCASAWDGRLRLLLQLCANLGEHVRALPRDKVMVESRSTVNEHSVADDTSSRALRVTDVVRVCVVCEGSLERRSCWR